MAEETASKRRAAVLRVVRGIPEGTVMGYAQVAGAAGLPGRARWVARVLAESAAPDVPWHRVVRSDGRVAFAVGTPSHWEQVARLRAEGVGVVAGRVQRTARADLQTSVDEVIWG